MLRFKQFVKEEQTNRVIQDFIEHTKEELGINELPQFEFIDDRSHALDHKSFGSYHPHSRTIRVNVAGRHTADILRTLAHEMTHHKQNEDGLFDEYQGELGETGNAFENDANSRAGVVLRNYGKKNPAIYEHFNRTL